MVTQQVAKELPSRVITEQAAQMEDPDSDGPPGLVMSSSDDEFRHHKLGAIISDDDPFDSDGDELQFAGMSLS